MTSMRLLATGIALCVLASPAFGDKKYDVGVTDTEIRIGNTMPYSGPASAYGTIGKAQAAYFEMINQAGGVSGRRIKLISLDDAYSPPRTVEQTRKLVEQEEVLLIFGSLGTPTNSAIHKYLNTRGVPHLFVSSNAAKWGDPKNYPWTMGWQPNYQIEAHIYAKYLLATRPGARIGVLYQNDDYGKDYLKGLKDGLGEKAALMISALATYEVTDATIDSQIITLQSAGADTFFDVTTPKFAAQAIRKSYDLGWKALHLLNLPSQSVASVLQPAGVDKSVGIVSASFLKDPADPQWKDDPAVRDYLAWMKSYYPEGSVSDWLNVQAYTQTQLLVHTLRRCGDQLTRENVMRQATSIRDLELPMLLPGIKVSTSASDYYPIKQMQLQRFDGARWVRFGELISP